MGIFQQAWALVEPAVPPTIALLGTVFLLFAIRFILGRVVGTREALPFRRQVASAVVVLVGLFAFIVVLPIDREIRSQILSVLGVLLSAVIALSSTTFVGNAMAGLMVRIVRGYRPGDFVQVGELLGRVSDQGLFHTEIQTITRDLVTVPNLYMIQHPVHVTRSGGTFVSASLSLGYDVAHQDAEAALHRAAEDAGLEEPFVMVNKIMDHAVEYEVYGLLKETKHLLTSQSSLRRAALDALHAAGIEVMSPQFVNRREYDPSVRFVPADRERGRDGERAESEEQEGSEEDVHTAEELAFDKAEEAESIERLKSLLKRLTKKQSELEEKAKEAAAQEREAVRAEAERTDDKVKRVRELVEEREKQRREEEVEADEPELDGEDEGPS